MEIVLEEPGTFSVRCSDLGWDQPRFELLATAIQAYQNTHKPRIPFPERYVVAYVPPGVLRLRTLPDVALEDVRKVVRIALTNRLEEAIALLRAVEAAE